MVSTLRRAPPPDVRRAAGGGTTPANKASRRTAMAQSRQSGAASAQADFDGDDTIAGCLDEFQRLPLLSLRRAVGAAIAVWQAARSAFVTTTSSACAVAL